MEELGIWEPYSVKVQIIKTAIESSCMVVLRIDDIVSGSKKATMQLVGEMSREFHLSSPTC